MNKRGSEKLNKKHVRFLFICLLMFSFMVVKVESAEPPLVAHGGSEYLYWDVYAPLEVKVGEEFSVIFQFRPVFTLDVVHLNVTLYGVIGLGGDWDWWKDGWTDIRMHWDATYTKTAYFTAVKGGPVGGTILATYDAGGERHLLSVNFGVTQIYAKTNEELESDYDSLNQSYSTLQKNYDSLEINLTNTRTLIYSLVITTGIFIATTVYLAVRKSRVRAT